ncbi:MAG TPA: PTS sugar transporter subunit IIC [Firmicutes bacterium]|nr:PTS sugar transporter subunit IIC [Candidatus Fermentithermobacillaceae bacterium]
MLIQAILASAWSGIARALGNQASLERPLICSTVVGIIYGNFGLGLAIGGTLELMWMGVEGIGGASPADVTVSSIFATAMACSHGYGVSEAVALAVPVSLLGNVIKQMVTSANSFFHRRFEALAEKGDIDALCKWTLWSTPYNFAVGFLIVFLGIQLGSDAVQALFESVPAWLTTGLGKAGGILPAVGFAMVLRMMYKAEYLPFLAAGFVLGAYLNMPILGVAILGAAVSAVLFSIRQQIKRVGGQG